MLFVGLGLAIFQQLVGINTVIYFAPTIFQLAGVSTSAAIGQTVFIGVTNALFQVPKTKGRSLEQIEEDLGAGTRAWRGSGRRRASA